MGIVGWVGDGGWDGEGATVVGGDVHGRGVGWGRVHGCRAHM